LTSFLKNSFDFTKSNQTKFILHILVWLMFFLIPIYDFIFSKDHYNYFFLVSFILSVFIFYINFGYLVSKFIIKKKWTSYLISLAILFSFFHYIISITRPSIEDFRINLVNPIPQKALLKEQIPFKEKPVPTPSLPAFRKEPGFRALPSLALFLLVISISSFLKIYEFLNENFKRQKEIENENRITELNFLKTQLNPHFFFNSLNTIYFLSIVQSPKTPQAILHLSDLMRYMLSDKNDNPIDKKVDLKDEIEYINNYIELQKLRITSNNKVVFNVEGKIRNEKIYPLLFISFIENAFKYGVHPVDEETIFIEFKIKDNIVEFNVVNQNHFQKKSHDSFGLGNENSIKRLNLYYPNNELTIKNTNKKYQVSLKIELDEN